MSKLNNHNFTVLFRRGLASAFSSYGAGFFEGEPGYTTDEKQVWIGDGSNVAHPVGGPRIVLTATTNDITASIPAGYCIDDVFIRNTTANAVTGGIKIGTTSGGTQIVASITVGANAFNRTLPSALTTSGPFSATAATTIYIQDVTAWNSASLNIVISLKRALT